jgi:DNA-binding NarL/FixJ family response regulator
MNISILLADDHTVMRTGLRGLLEQQDGISVAAEAGNGREAVDKALELSPAVVLMDIGLPELNGIEATRQIARSGGPTKVIILSMHADHHFIMSAVKAGAKGYLLKDCSIDEVVRAVRTVAAGRSYFSSDIAGHVVTEYVTLSKRDGEPAGLLTNKEREVLQLLAEGRSSRQIAGTLSVSERTVESHRHQIMRKLNIHSVAELTKYAIREGITSV